MQCHGMLPRIAGGNPPPAVEQADGMFIGNKIKSKRNRPPARHNYHLKKYNQYRLKQERNDKSRCMDADKGHSLH